MSRPGAADYFRNPLAQLGPRRTCRGCRSHASPMGSSPRGLATMFPGFGTTCSTISAPPSTTLKSSSFFDIEPPRPKLGRADGCVTTGSPGFLARLEEDGHALPEFVKKELWAFAGGPPRPPRGTLAAAPRRPAWAVTPRRWRDRSRRVARHPRPGRDRLVTQPGHLVVTRASFRSGRPCQVVGV